MVTQDIPKLEHGAETIPPLNLYYYMVLKLGIGLCLIKISRLGRDRNGRVRTIMNVPHSIWAVSYTHLDVYKRQTLQ